MARDKKEVVEAFETIIDGLNSMGSDHEVGEALVEVLSKTHRTLQQNFFRVVVKGAIIFFAKLKKDNWFDLRNEGTVTLAEKIEPIVNDAYLPYV